MMPLPNIQHIHKFMNEKHLSQSFRKMQELETSERPGHKLVARLPRQIRLKRGYERFGFGM